MSYIVYFKTDGNLYRICNDALELSTIEHLPSKISSFHLTKPYEATDEDLKQYATDISIASKELSKSKELRNFNYIEPYKMGNNQLYYRTHRANILSVFKMKALTEWNKHENITATEALWMERCYNAGLQYCEPGEYECYGYDFSNFYAGLLGDNQFSELQIPTKAGKEMFLTELSTPLQPGFYRIAITCTDKNIHKVFSFSNDNVYHYLSIKFIQELNKFHGFSIKYDLIIDDEPNAYIYHHNDLIKTKEIFKDWFKCMKSLKKKYPKNMLVKILSSSLWGHLSCKNTFFMPSDNVNDLKGTVGITDDCDYKIVDLIIKDNGEELYELQHTSKPYAYNIRLKPFITAYGRNKTARVALRMIDDVIRIHTDGIAFKKQINFELENFNVEKKTTGCIRFNNINNYERL